MVSSGQGLAHLCSHYCISYPSRFFTVLGHASLLPRSSVLPRRLCSCSRSCLLHAKPYARCLGLAAATRVLQSPGSEQDSCAKQPLLLEASRCNKYFLMPPSLHLAAFPASTSDSPEVIPKMLVALTCPEGKMLDSDKASPPVGPYMAEGSWEADRSSSRAAGSCDPGLPPLVWPATYSQRGCGQVQGHTAEQSLSRGLTLGLQIPGPSDALPTTLSAPLGWGARRVQNRVG